jgi:hypothetical protein
MLKSSLLIFFSDVDTVFNCLGTTRWKSGSAENFVKVERDLTDVLCKTAKSIGL